MGRYSDNVVTHRVDNGLHIAGFVGGEPGPVVIFLELIEEFEKIRRQTFELGHFIKMDTCNNVRNTDSANSRAYTGRNYKNGGPAVSATGS
jgi:hypothetical protein